MSKSRTKDTQSEEFLALKAKWYAKLKDKGFKDIEQDEDRLKFWNASYARVQLTPAKVAAREEYYRLAGFFLHDHKFNGNTERTIWRMHSEGLSIRNISKALDKPERRMLPKTVNKLLQKFAKQMILEYSNKNMDDEA